MLPYVILLELCTKMTYKGSHCTLQPLPVLERPKCSLKLRTLVTNLWVLLAISCAQQKNTV